MKLLLDSHLLIWTAAGSGRLPKRALPLLNDKENELFFSSASLWEITIKAAAGRQDFQVDPRLLLRNLLDNGYIELPVTSRHGIAVLGLPSLHKDPFDRLLVAQAIVEGITLLTVDTTVANYPGPIRKV
ncbi:type II toxin-antitoxin system VapC family toxin [Granulicella mallensis]|uniref:type II toxin-antitoxin system VapC family toxin n=1 Tax=Granulicella mallensis TaxID=940614 RepID=UPI00160DDCC3|nr:type II toxin-antitoxin system VapC family toxin [Granulicella mallensis]